jgi:ABC-2 type transport system permease protein
VQVVIDGRNSNTAMLALNSVRAVVTEFNQERIEQTTGAKLPARLALRAWFNPNLESHWFIVPGIIALLAMIVTLVVTALSVAREREAGTFDQLLVTPLRPWEIMVGKAMPGLIVGVGEASLIILVAVFWFKVPLVGPLTTLYPALIIYVLSIIGVGLMISSFSATLQQALLGSFLFIVPAVILSGFSTPIANMPPFMQSLTLLDPMRYFLTIVRRVFLEGAGIEYFWHELWPMTVIALVTLSLATWLFRHRMY